MAAINLVFSYTEKQVETWTLPATTDAGVAVVDANGRPGVTVTPTGDFTESLTVGPYTVSGIQSGGVGHDDKGAAVAIDGTWDFEVAGADSDTAQNTRVYAIVSSGAVTGLTLTEGSNTPFGTINYPKSYDFSRGLHPVKIGVFA